MCKRLRILLPTLFLLISACRDLPTESSAVDAEEEAIAIEQTAVEGLEAESFLDEEPSTICTVYGDELLRIQTLLSGQADDPVLDRQAATFEELIAHTCK